MKRIYQEIFSAIKKANNILLPLHLNPDGDAIASVLAMGKVLRSMKKRYLITSTDEVPEQFSFLPGFDSIKHQEFVNVDLSKFDLIFFLDISSLKDRFTFRQDFSIPQDIVTVNVDHHQTNTKFAQYNLVEPDLISTCEILVELFRSGGIEINKDLANCLLFGILTDSGGFQYPSTSSITLKTAAWLMDAGANLGDLTIQTFRNRHPLSLEYLKVFLENMKMDKKNRFFLGIIPYAMMSKLEQSKVSVDGTENWLLNGIAGMDFAFVLKEKEPGELVVGSLRSRGDLDVSQIAALLGGGGHKAAAGFRIVGKNLREAEKEVLVVIRKYLREKKR